MSAHTFDVGSPFYHLARGEYDKVPERWKMIDENTPARPDCTYAVGKLFGETCGRYFSDRFGLTVIVIRCGAVLRSDRLKIVGLVPGFLSHADTAQIVGLSLGAPQSLKCDIFNAVSDNHWSWRDNTHAREMLGFRPTGNSDGYDLAIRSVPTLGRGISSWQADARARIATPMTHLAWSISRRDSMLRVGITSPSHSDETSFARMTPSGNIERPSARSAATDTTQ